MITAESAPLWRCGNADQGGSSRDPHPFLVRDRQTSLHRDGRKYRTGSLASDHDPARQGLHRTSGPSHARRAARVAAACHSATHPRHATMPGAPACVLGRSRSDGPADHDRDPQTDRRPQRSRAARRVRLPQKPSSFIALNRLEQIAAPQYSMTRRSSGRSRTAGAQ